jgi:hypothetical protein
MPVKRSYGRAGRMAFSPKPSKETVEYLRCRLSFDKSLPIEFDLAPDNAMLWLHALQLLQKRHGWPSADLRPLTKRDLN